MMAVEEHSLSVELVRSRFSYDPDTGRLYWREARGARKAGDEAGTVSSRGYIVVKTEGRDFFVHRLIWAAVHGEWPTCHIDHINGDRADNRITNLRLATTRQNAGNRGAAKSSVHSRFKGVDWKDRAKGWRARCGRKHVGMFATEEEAARAHDRAALEYFGEFARLNFPAEAE